MEKSPEPGEPLGSQRPDPVRQAELRVLSGPLGSHDQPRTCQWHWGLAGVGFEVRR